MKDIISALQFIVSEISQKDVEIAELRQQVYDLQNMAAKQERREGNITKIYMSPQEATIRYGICTTTLYELLAMPECPDGIKMGKKRLLPIAAFDAFIEKTFSNGFMDGKPVRTPSLNINI